MVRAWLVEAQPGCTCELWRGSCRSAFLSAGVRGASVVYRCEQLLSVPECTLRVSACQGNGLGGGHWNCSLCRRVYGCV